MTLTIHHRHVEEIGCFSPVPFFFFGLKCPNAKGLSSIRTLDNFETRRRADGIPFLHLRKGVADH
jgi:hypothetical protein